MVAVYNNHHISGMTSKSLNAEVTSSTSQKSMSAQINKMSISG